MSGILERLGISANRPIPGRIIRATGTTPDGKKIAVDLDDRTLATIIQGLQMDIFKTANALSQFTVTMGADSTERGTAEGTGELFIEQDTKYVWYDAPRKVGDATAPAWVKIGYIAEDGSTPLTAPWDAVYGIKTDYIQLDITYVDGVYEGRLQWNSEDGTPEVGMPGGNVNLQIGQELLTRIKAGGTLLNGSVVYVSGSTGANIVVGLADGTDWDKSYLVAIMTEAVSTGSLGYVNLAGKVRDIDTSHLTEGMPVYIDPATPGGTTSTKPVAPYSNSVVGVCQKSHATEGIIHVHPVPMRIHADTRGLDQDDHPQYPKKNGWDTKYNSNVTMSFTDGTLTFSIQPTGTKFAYWNDGIQYTSTGDTVVITDTEGIWFFYYVGATLTASQTPWGIYDNDKALVAIIYWDATNKKHLLLGPELHSWVMDPATHHYLHYTFGTRWESGLGVAEVTPDTLDVTAGIIHDEDIEISITDGVGGGVWEQDLSPAKMPIFYRSGASGDWRKIAATTVPCYLDTNILQINTYSGGTWGLAPVTLNRYCAYWIVATNDQTEPVISIPGQEDGATLAAAVDGNKLADMAFGNLPVVEAKVIARVIIQRISGSPYYSIEQIDDYRNVSDEPAGGASIIGDHGAMTGLGDDDHTQYFNTTRLATVNPGDDMDSLSNNVGLRSKNAADTANHTLIKLNASDQPEVGASALSLKLLGTDTRPDYEGADLALHSDVTSLDKNDFPFTPTFHATTTVNITAWGGLHLINTTVGNVTVNLPTAAGNPGREIILKRTTGGANTITVTPNGSETIDNSATNTELSSQHDFIGVMSDNSNVRIVRRG